MVVVAVDWNNFSTTDSSGRANASGARDTWHGQLFPAAGLSRTATCHTVFAVCLGVIFVLGVLNNSLVLVTFARFRCLRTPINVILLNISVSDLLVCVFGTPFSFAANLHGRWLIGPRGCQWYAFANSLFGKLVRRTYDL